MTRTQFDEEIQQIRACASRMASLVEEAIRRSAKAVLERDMDAAAMVVKGDEEINKLHRELREKVFTTVSTQAPVAGDLRLVLGTQYIAVELERMGDYAVRIAKRAKKLASEPETGPSTYVELARMAVLVEQQVKDMLEAFISVDAEGARQVAQRDDAIDQLYHQVFAQQIAALSEDPEHVLRAQYLINVAHTLERIGDRVTNVLEDIVFLATGEVVELD